MDIDKVIAQLFECKPIPEPEVKLLCDKVGPPRIYTNVSSFNRETNIK